MSVCDVDGVAVEITTIVHVFERTRSANTADAAPKWRCEAWCCLDVLGLA